MIDTGDTVTWRQCNDGAFRSAACDSLDTVWREKSLKGKKRGKGKRVFGKDKAYYAEQNAATSLGKHDSCRNGGNWGPSNKTSG